MQYQIGEIVLKDLKQSKIKWLLTDNLLAYYFDWILFILCEYIMGKVFDLMSHDSWFMTRFWIFMTEILCYQEPFHDKTKKWKSMELSVDLWHLNNMKIILTLWTLIYVVCFPFSCIDSFHIVHNQTN